MKGTSLAQDRMPTDFSSQCWDHHSHWRSDFIGCCAGCVRAGCRDQQHYLYASAGSTSRLHHGIERGREFCERRVERKYQGADSARAGRKPPTYVYRYDSNGVYTLTPTWTTSSGGSGSFTTLQYLNLVVPYAPPSAQPQPLLETTTVQTGQYTYTTYQCQITSGYVSRTPMEADMARSLHCNCCFSSELKRLQFLP